MSKNRTVAIKIAVFLVAAFFLSQCKIIKYSGSTISMDKFRITDDAVGSWKETEGGFSEYASLDELTKIINGGSEYYKEFFMREGIYQTMANGDKSYEVLVMDFGTEERAEAIYTDQKNKVITTRQIGSFSPSNVIGNEDALGSTISAYAYFGQYYVEIKNLSGANKPELRSEANQFMIEYENKVNKQRQDVE